MSCFVSYCSRALIATVYYNIALLRVWQRAYGTKNSLARILPVSRIYIHMERAQTKWAMISRGISKRQYLFSAILTNKAVIVFRKSFVLHKVFLLYDFPTLGKTKDNQSKTGGFLYEKNLRHRCRRADLFSAWTQSHRRV